MSKIKISTVTVVGANGAMGSGIAGVFASFGNAKVYLVCRDMEKAEIAREKACKSVRTDIIKPKLIPADYSMLERCVKESDLVFESTAENMDIKLDVTRQIARFVKPETIVCSGTSGLSVTRLAEVLSPENKEKYFGVHMFNPPYMMSLCELIPTKYSNKSYQDMLYEYLEKTLYRTVILVKDSPAFLANRIGLQFMNEAMLYAEKNKDKGGIDYMDAILGPFTGRAMSPLATSDFIGLDVHKAIVDNVYQNTKDYARETFKMPAFAEALIKENKLGRKTGQGLFKSIKNEDGTRKTLVYDITFKDYRDKKIYDFAFADNMKKNLEIGDYTAAMKALLEDSSEEAGLCLKFLLHYIVYALITTKDVAFDIHAADDAMGAGFNWVPPIGLAQALSQIADLKQIIKENLDEEIIKVVESEGVLENLPKSKYDYRSYFKAAK